MFESDVFKNLNLEKDYVLEKIPIELTRLLILFDYFDCSQELIKLNLPTNEEGNIVSTI